MKSTDDCLDPGFGHENSDGYVRICDKPRPSGGKLVMRHRWFWELINGPIPDGMEINHICKNRRCCNVNHLEVIESYHHRVLDNRLRYKEMIDLGLEMLRDGRPDSEVAEVTGRSIRTVQKWRYKNCNGR